MLSLLTHLEKVHSSKTQKLWFQLFDESRITDGGRWIKVLISNGRKNPIQNNPYNINDIYVGSAAKLSRKHRTTFFVMLFHQLYEMSNILFTDPCASDQI